MSTATGRRVTPTAVLVLPATADRAAWLAKRRRGVGSSDVAALMGASAYAGPQHVYYDKVGRRRPDGDAGEAALWGTLHEETVAREWARRNRTVVRRVGLVAHVQDPWMMCTLDRRCTECPLNPADRENCAVEIKTRDRMLAPKWRKDVPDDVLAQVLWQIAVTGYDHLHVAVLIGGNDYRQYTVRRAGNEDLIGDIVTVARKFWFEYVKAGVVPEPSGTEDPDRLVDLYNEVAGTRGGWVDLAAHPTAYEDLLDYERARLAEAEAARPKKAARARLVAALGSSEYARFDGEDAYGFVTSKRQTVDVKRLAERWPDAYHDCVHDKPSRRLEIAPKYQLKEAVDVAA